MRKIRTTFVNIVAVLALLLMVSRADVPRYMYVLLIGFFLVNRVFEEWNKYLETKNKFHLLIPVTAIILVIFSVIQLITV